MNADQRAAVRDSAKYLRGVRPLDPEELATYVEGEPHPAVVRQVLRELAVQLDLVERADGTFVPVPDGPVSPPEDTVEGLPGWADEGLAEALVDEFGHDWHRGRTAAQLRDRIRSIKAAYLAGDPVDYDREGALAYAVYHLADYYATLHHVVGDLARDGLLGHRLRVLDVGAGVGGPALGLLDALPDDALVTYHAVEPSDAAADLLERFLADAGRNVHWTVHRTTAEKFADDWGWKAEDVTPSDPDAAPPDVPTGDTDDDPPQAYDLLLFANVLSELEAPGKTAARYAAGLAPAGSLVCVAPADRETSLGLRRVERHLVDTGPTADALDVYAPTVRLWPGHAPTDECWAFDVKPDIEPPDVQRRLDDGDATCINVDVQFSHAVLRPDGRRRVAITPDPARWMPMAESADHVTQRVDCLGIKLTHSLTGDRAGEEARAADEDTAGGAREADPADPDAPNPVFKMSDGSEDTSHFAVLVEETVLNGPLREAAHGAPLAFEGALLLWNDDEGAYNLVVDDETVVDDPRVAVDG
jgi:SAM-dependent methyltransferase